MQNDPWRWEKGETSVDRWATSVKSCEAEHCDHPERIGRQVGDKCEIMRTKALRELRESRVSFAGKPARRHTPNHRPGHGPLSKE